MIERSDRRRPARRRSSPSLPCSIRMASSTSSSLVRSGSRAAASRYSRRSSASSVPSGRAGSGMNSLSSSKPPYGAHFAPGGLRDRSQSIGPRAYEDRPPRATGDHASPTPTPCKGDAYVDLMELPSIPRSVPVEAAGRETPPDIHMAASAGMRPGYPTRVRCARLGRKGGGMDRDTLQDDLDLILERSRDDELPGEWDWEPPLGTGTPVAISAAELRESEETDTEASAMQRAPRSTGQRRSRRRSGGRRRRRRRNRTTERSPG